MAETEGIKDGGAVITSTANDRIKRAVALRDKRERDRTGLMLIEGVREIERAMTAGIAFERVYFCRSVMSSGEEAALLASLVESKMRTVEVTARVFEKLAYRGGSGGLLAVARQPAADLSILPASGEALFLVVESVEKPGNLGAIVRCADGAGAAGVIACGGGTDLFNPNAVRASLGTVFTVPCARAEAAEVVRWLRETGTRIVTATPGGDALYTAVDFTGRLAIAVGAEDAGVTAAWLEAADERVLIPMKGAADSLNVSATAAILLYEALRQREAR